LPKPAQCLPAGTLASQLDPAVVAARRLSSLPYTLHLPVRLAACGRRALPATQPVGVPERLAAAGFPGQPQRRALAPIWRRGASSRPWNSSGIRLATANRWRGGELDDLRLQADDRLPQKRRAGDRP